MHQWLYWLLLLVIAHPALATDGVSEISQTCATQTGCFSGDTTGFPVTITTPGSYRLTSRIVLPNENTDGILVSTSSVTIDLNGFEIAGPVTCSGGPIVCAPAGGTGSGVDRSLTTNRSITVKNGSVTGTGSTGIFLGEQAEVTNVRVRWSGAGGIRTSSSSLITGNAVFENSGDGILVGVGSTVTSNSAYHNSLDGIETNSGSTISNNSASFNGGSGIDTLSASTVSGNTAYNNTSNGIDAGLDCTIIGNTAYSNTLDGIQVGGGTMVQKNNAQNNTGFGMVLDLRATYRENTVGDNTGGTVQENGAIDMGSNSCNGTTSCP